MTIDRAEEELVASFVEGLTRTYDRAYWLEHARAGRPLDELWAELGRTGWLGAMIPEAYGGTGPSMARLALLIETLCARGVPSFYLVVSAAMSTTCVVRHGTDAQRRRILPDLAAGNKRFCFAITEPDAGSNSFRIRTRARRDGDDYVISGQKVFISGAKQADHMLLVAQTGSPDDAAERQRSISLFVIDTDSAGIEHVPMEMDVLIPERQYQVFLDDVRVPAENRIGTEGRGMAAMFDALNPERIAVAAFCIGLGRFALDKAVRYACERVVFDRPIGAHQSIAHPLAEVKTDLELATLMARHAAELFDSGAGADAGLYANMAKMTAAEAAIRAVDVAIQVHGGSGFTTDVDLLSTWPLVRMMRTAPVSRELILNHIAEHGLGLPRSYGR